jgi:hypothetical protein
MANTTKKATTTTTTKAATTKAKQAAKKAPERELDWRAIGIVKEHRSARQRGKRKIDRIKARYLAYSTSAFIMGASIGIMIFTWLH